MAEPSPIASSPLAAGAFEGSLHFVVNPASGGGDPLAAIHPATALLTRAGREHELLVVDAPRHVERIARRAVDTAARRGGAVVAVGGDGTLNAVAQAALPAQVPFGAVPQGTFNYFGRAHGLASEPIEAVAALLAATPRPVQVGLVNDRVFLVNASLGLHPQLLVEREAWERQLGRGRAVALAAGFATLLREHRQLALRIEHETGARRLRALTLFVGNNRLQLERLGIPESAEVDRDRLAAVLVRPTRPLATVALALRGALGRLGDAESATSFAFGRMTVEPALPYGRRRLRVAIDGETTRLATPLDFRVSPVPLRLLVTPPE